MASSVVAYVLFEGDISPSTDGPSLALGIWVGAVGGIVRLYSTVPRNSQDRHCSEGRTDEDLGIIGGPDGPKDPTGRLDSVAGRFARHDWLYFAARIYRRQKESG